MSYHALQSAVFLVVFCCFHGEFERWAGPCTCTQREFAVAAAVGDPNDQRATKRAQYICIYFLFNSFSMLLLPRTAL